MSDNFDWRTEEDDEWDGGRPQGVRKARRRQWLLPLAIVMAVVIAGGAIYWQVQERVSSAEAAISDDIVSSFQLIRQANETGDIELFRNLLSGTDLSWAVAQQDLFAQGQLFDLSPFGLSTEPQSVRDIEATLSPQLNSAEVNALATYGTMGSDAPQDAVTLLQTSVFRRGERWVWSPPKSEFWAGNASTREGHLTVSYPKRDQALVLRIARDLDQMIGELCTDFERLTCPNDLTLNLVFSHEPDALVELGERFAEEGVFGSRLSGRSASGNLKLTLPTPSLLGLPVDEASYQALFRGYGTHVAIGLANKYVDRDCCGSVARLRAAMRKMLTDLGLNAWPPVEVAATAERSASPDQKQVALLCSNGFGRQQRMLILDLQEMAWRQETTDGELLEIKSMPDGEGVLLLSQMADGEDVRSQVWHHSGAGNDLLFELPVSPEQADQIGWEVQERQGLLLIEVPDRGYSRYFTFDLKRCGEGRCSFAPETTVSRPVWSPDGSQLLVRAYGLLWWRVGASMVPIAEGSAPFWVNDESYGYVRSFGQEQALVLVRAGEEESEQVILTTNDLRDAMEAQTRPNRLLIGRVIVSHPEVDGQPGYGDWGILALEIEQDGAVNHAHFFAYSPDSDKVYVIPHVGRLLSFNVTPSRERMAMAGFVEDQRRWVISVVGQDLPEPVTLTLEPGGTIDAIPSYSWSADESWLLVLEQGLLTLFHPATGSIQQVKSPDASCVEAAWYGTQGTP